MRTSPWTALLLLPLSACSGGSTTAAPEPTVTISAAPTITTAPPATASPTPTLVPTRSPSPSATPTKARVETAPPPGAPTCKASDLTVTDADMVVTQKTREEVYVIRTHGPDCGLKGWPTVTLMGSDGKPMSVMYSHDGSTPTALSLSKGTSVSFSVSTSRTGTCVDASRISAVLPGTTTALSASTTARACNGAVTVSPVRRLQAES